MMGNEHTLANQLYQLLATPPTILGLSNRRKYKKLRCWTADLRALRAQYLSIKLYGSSAPNKHPWLKPTV